jgi:ketosteroid isomerase-like protein
MSEQVMRDFVHAFCDALASRDYDAIGGMLADNVECTAFGPIDVFPFFVHRRGRAAVLEMLRQASERLSVRGCDTECALVDGENYASLVRMTAEQVSTGRVLNFRLAQFVQLHGGRLTSLRVLFDSLDLAEQIIGRPIDLSRAA